MQVTYDLNQAADKKAYRTFLKKTVPGKNNVAAAIFALLWPVTLLLVIVSLWIGAVAEFWVVVMVFLLSMIACSYLLLKLAVMKMILYSFFQSVRYCGQKHTVSVTEDGIRSLGKGIELYAAWDYVEGIINFNGGAYVSTKAKGLLLPEYAFGSREEFEDFVNTANSYWKMHRDQADVPAKSPPWTKRSQLSRPVWPIIVGMIALLVGQWSYIRSTSFSLWNFLPVMGSSDKLTYGFWLGMIEERDFEAAYAMTTPRFRQLYSQEQLKDAITPHIEHLGKLEHVYAWEGDYSLYNYASDGEGPNRKSKKLLALKLQGTDSMFYGICHLTERNGEWQIAGFDIVAPRVVVDKYSDHIEDPLKPNWPFNLELTWWWGDCLDDYQQEPSP